MAASASVNGHAVEESAAGVGENVVNLAYDLVSLSELQAKLLLLDLQEGSAQAAAPTALLTGGVCLALGSLPVLLLGLGGVLATWTSLSTLVAWLIVSTVALLVGAVSIRLAVVQLRQASLILMRSRSELNETISWIKKVIQQTSFASRN